MKLKWAFITLAQVFFLISAILYFDTDFNDYSYVFYGPLALTSGIVFMMIGYLCYFLAFAVKNREIGEGRND